MDLGIGKDGEKGFADKGYRKEFLRRREVECTARGEAMDDPKKEEEYLKRMLNHCMRAHICYRELDAYSDCLIRKKALLPENVANELDVNNEKFIKKCPTEAERYSSCMGNREHQATLINSAMGHPKCEGMLPEVIMCLQQKEHLEPKVRLEACSWYYRRALRCGLNHLWEAYWRGITNFGEEQENYLYEIYRGQVQSGRIADTGDALRQQLNKTLDRQEGRGPSIVHDELPNNR